MNRRDCIAGMVLTCAAWASGAHAAPGKAATILVVGDSISAEYGLARGTGWVTLLEKQIAALENKMRREKQLNRQMEMNAELKKLRIKLRQIT